MGKSIKKIDLLNEDNAEAIIAQLREGCLNEHWYNDILILQTFASVIKVT